ncbi:hypothetical protein CSA56_06675 [candidate division KSB3 bacterium]|uniref:Uncharacterized protein n=1 Tax=candidate division KSB3 bacterium TaxID=2044937 RepID=A0A2G6KGQ6_9BACT|nr:MAG: hypothetical protein CSA56_06675 [candidate division KSB3 bacterium]
MVEEIQKDSVYAVMGLIYKVLKKQNVITDAFIERTIHVDASTKKKADELSEEEKLIWYMVMILFKIIFEEAGNYFKYKEQDPEKWTFLNENRPFYQSMNRVDLTRSYIFEKAISELKKVNFQGLKEKTGVLLDPKLLGNIVRADIVRRTQEV